MKITLTGTGTLKGTGTLRGTGWHSYLVEKVVELGDRFDPETVTHLVSTYGTGYPRILAYVEDDPYLAQPLVPGLPYLKAEVRHAVRHEMALSLEDVLGRRTHVMDQVRDNGLGVAREVAAHIGAELGWSETDQVEQVKRYRGVVEQARRWRS